MYLDSYLLLPTFCPYRVVLPPPERLYFKVKEHFISEALEKAKWEDQFQRGSSRLAELAEELKDRISKGGAEPMDFSKL